MTENLIPFSHLRKEALKNAMAIMFINVFDADHNPYYAYMAIHATKADEFARKQRQKGVKLEDYGIMLESGRGLYPPVAVRKEMLTRYGFDTDEAIEQQARHYNPEAEGRHG